MSEPRLMVLQWDGTPVSEMRQFGGFDLRVRYNDVGTWRLDAPRDVLINLLDRKRKIGLHYNGLFITGIVLGLDVRPGQAEGIAVGVTDLAYLAMRRALPEVNGNFAAQDYDVRSGTVETVVKGYVKDNASAAAAITERAFPFSVADDQARGSSVTGRARFHKLLDLCADLLTAEGQNYRMVLTNGIFEIEPIVDRRGAPILADWRNAAWGVAWGAPKATRVYAGGSGVGTARIIIETANLEDEMNWWRIEDFYDARSVSDVNELAERASARLARDAAQYGFVMQAPARGFGTEYREGDLLTAQANGVPVDGRLIEVQISYDESAGWHETVGVGVQVTPAFLERLRLADIAREIENLEVTV